MSKPSKEAELAEFKDRLATAQGHRAAEQMELARGEYVQALAFAEQHFGADSEQVDEVCLELALFYCAVKEPESGHFLMFCPVQLSALTVIFVIIRLLKTMSSWEIV